MNTKQFNSIINLFYLSFILVWQPIRLLFIHADAKGRIQFFLTLLVLLINFAYNPEVKKILFRKPFVIWLCWIVFAFINMMIKGYNYTSNTPLFFFVNNLFTPYFAMVLTCQEYNVSKKRFIKVVVISALLYCVLGYFFMGRVRSEDDSSFSLGNSLAVSASLSAFFLCIARLNKQMKAVTFVSLISFVLVVVITTATRKAFGVVLIIMAFYFLSLIGLKRRNVLLVAIMTIGAYIGLNYMMENTNLGERLSNIDEQAMNQNVIYNDSEFLKFVGDRAPHYVYGWAIFKTHPITGVGLCNFQSVSGFYERLHTDYMIQFAENGLIGLALFVWYYLWFILHILTLRRQPHNKGYLLFGLGWIVAVLFLGLTAWTYDSPMIFICSGVIASLIISDSKNVTQYEK